MRAPSSGSRHAGVAIRDMSVTDIEYARPHIRVDLIGRTVDGISARALRLLSTFCRVDVTA
jgi:hypothetical protein